MKHRHHLKPKHRGGTDDDGIVEVSVIRHAMFHWCEWKLHGHWQDKLAWQALTKQIGLAQISEEVKRQRYAKLSANVSGVPKSEAHKKATGRANKRAYAKEEVRERCRVAKAAKMKAVVCSNGETYRSITEASRTLGINRVSIQRVLRGECKQGGGYTFSYK
jgi:hypothetical protein